MFEFIKEIHRKKIIRTLKASPREKKIDNIDEVRSIGVICRLGDEQNWNILNHFAKVMENQGKRVTFMALLEREQDINFVITHQGTHIVRSKSDMNFWGLPNNDTIRPFVEQHYDLLIDTIGEENFDDSKNGETRYFRDSIKRVDYEFYTINDVSYSEASKELAEEE